MEQKKLTDEKINDLADKVDQLLDLKVKGPQRHSYFELHHSKKFGELQNAFKDNRKPRITLIEFTDDNGNVFIQLPTIYVNWGQDFIAIDFEKPDDSAFIALQPQAISKYKNSLIEGKVRSIPNVPPNFNQMSYKRFEEFIKLADGEMLHWETVLYLQIMFLFIIELADTPTEDSDWDLERYTGYQDTGKGINEFLGIEQLFSGYTVFSLDGLVASPFKSLFIDLGMIESSSGYIGNYGYYKYLFFPYYRNDVSYGWYPDGGARLCKPPLNDYQKKEGNK